MSQSGTDGAAPRPRSTPRSRRACGPAPGSPSGPRRSRSTPPSGATSWPGTPCGTAGGRSGRRRSAPLAPPVPWSPARGELAWAARLPAGHGRAGAVHLPRPAPLPRVAAGLARRDGAPHLRVAAGGRRTGRRPPPRRRRRTNVRTLDALKRTARRWRTRATRWAGSWTDAALEDGGRARWPRAGRRTCPRPTRGRAPAGRPPAGGGRGRRAAGHLRGAGRPAVRRGRRRRPRASCRRWAAVLNALKGGGRAVRGPLPRRGAARGRRAAPGGRRGRRRWCPTGRWAWPRRGTWRR